MRSGMKIDATIQACLSRPWRSLLLLASVRFATIAEDVSDSRSRPHQDATFTQINAKSNPKSRFAAANQRASAVDAVNDRNRFQIKEFGTTRARNLGFRCFVIAVRRFHRLHSRDSKVNAIVFSENLLHAKKSMSVARWEFKIAPVGGNALRALDVDTTGPMHILPNSAIPPISARAT
jgi:hypothetical protein